jgi:hypothetical protein
MKQEIRQLNPFYFQYDASLLKGLEQIQNPSLVTVAKVFRENIISFGSIPTVPTYFALRQTYQDIALDRYLMEERSLPFKDAKKRIEKYKSENTDVGDKFIRDKANQFMELILEVDGFRQAVRLLLTSTTVMCWSAFETAVSDTWDSAFSTKSSSIALAGINLKPLLGDIPRRKLDFTRIDGIKNAYKIFGLTNELDHIWSDSVIKHLHLDRNLIVHRAGIIDSSYASEMKKHNLPCYGVGKPLYVDAMFVAHFINKTIAAVRDIMLFTDNWLSQSK